MLFLPSHLYPGKWLRKSFPFWKMTMQLISSTENWLNNGIFPFYGQITPTERLLYSRISHFLSFLSFSWRIIHDGNILQYLIHWLLIMKGNNFLAPFKNYLAYLELIWCASFKEKGVKLSKFIFSFITRIHPFDHELKTVKTLIFKTFLSNICFLATGCNGRMTNGLKR